MLATRLMASGVKSRTFTTSQTFVLPSGVTKIRAIAIGGGGAGGYGTGFPLFLSGGGGGAGGAIRATVNVISGSSVSVVIGSASSSQHTIVTAGGYSMYAFTGNYGTDASGSTPGSGGSGGETNDGGGWALLNAQIGESGASGAIPSYGAGGAAPVFFGFSTYGRGGNGSAFLYPDQPPTDGVVRVEWNF